MGNQQTLHLSDTLNISGKGLRTFPGEIKLSKARVLRSLILAQNRFVDLPEELGSLCPNVKRLNLSWNLFPTVPRVIFDLNSLDALDMRGNYVRDFPTSEAHRWTNITEITFSQNQFTSFPDFPSSTRTTLKILDLRANRIAAIPLLPSFHVLRFLVLGNNVISSLPSVPPTLPSLSVLDLSYNALSTIPSHFFAEMPALERLDLRCNRITRLPDDVFHYGLGQLHLLHLQNNQLEELPSSLLELASLTELFLSDNQLTHISFPSWGALSRLRLLVLGGNRLTSVRTLAGLTGLVELDLHGNRLTALPGGLALCEHLAMVRFDRNRITHLSPDFFQATQLSEVWLDCNELADLSGPWENLQVLHVIRLGSNRLRRLPHNFGQLPRLAEVNLSFNFFRHIPFILADCKSLENIIMAGNRIIELPPWLAQLPRLSQLVLSHNLITAVPTWVGRLRLSALALDGNLLDRWPDAISSLTNLQKLSLEGNSLGPTLPPDAFSRLGELSVLSLAAAGLTSLPRSLYNLSRLAALDISYNGITEIAVDALVERMGDLKYLDLSFNPIRNVGDLYRATQRKSDVSRATLALQIPLSMLPEGQPGLQIRHLSAASVPSLRAPFARPVGMHPWFWGLLEHARRTPSQRLPWGAPAPPPPPPLGLPAVPHVPLLHALAARLAAFVGYSETIGRRPTMEDSLVMCPFFGDPSTSFPPLPPPSTVTPPPPPCVSSPPSPTAATNAAAAGATPERAPSLPHSAPASPANTQPITAWPLFDMAALASAAQRDPALLERHLLSWMHIFACRCPACVALQQGQWALSANASPGPPSLAPPPVMAEASSSTAPMAAAGPSPLAPAPQDSVPAPTPSQPALSPLTPPPATTPASSTATAVPALSPTSMPPVATTPTTPATTAAPVAEVAANGDVDAKKQATPVPEGPSSSSDEGSSSTDDDSDDDAPSHPPPAGASSEHSGPPVEAAPAAPATTGAAASEATVSSLASTTPAALLPAGPLSGPDAGFRSVRVRRPPALEESAEVSKLGASSGSGASTDGALGRMAPMKPLRTMTLGRREFRGRTVTVLQRAASTVHPPHPPGAAVHPPRAAPTETANATAPVEPAPPPPAHPTQAAPREPSPSPQSALTAALRQADAAAAAAAAAAATASAPNGLPPGAPTLAPAAAATAGPAVTCGGAADSSDADADESSSGTPPTSPSPEPAVPRSPPSLPPPRRHQIRGRAAGASASDTGEDNGAKQVRLSASAPSEEPIFLSTLEPTTQAAAPPQPLAQPLLSAPAAMAAAPPSPQLPPPLCHSQPQPPPPPPPPPSRFSSTPPPASANAVAPANPMASRVHEAMYACLFGGNGPEVAPADAPPPAPCGLYAVFDGHGGPHAAEFCAQHLPTLFYDAAHIYATRAAASLPPQVSAMVQEITRTNTQSPFMVLMDMTTNPVGSSTPSLADAPTAGTGCGLVQRPSASLAAPLHGANATVSAGSSGSALTTTGSSAAVLTEATAGVTTSSQLSNSGTSSQQPPSRPASSSSARKLPGPPARPLPPPGLHPVCAILQTTFGRLTDLLRLNNIEDGSTALVCVVTPGQLFIANLGDCRAVLVRQRRRTLTLTARPAPAGWVPPPVLSPSQAAPAVRPPGRRRGASRRGGAHATEPASPPPTPSAGLPPSAAPNFPVVPALPPPPPAEPQMGDSPIFLSIAPSAATAAAPAHTSGPTTFVSLDDEIALAAAVSPPEPLQAPAPAPPAALGAVVSATAVATPMDDAALAVAPAIPEPLADARTTELLPSLTPTPSEASVVAISPVTPPASPPRLPDDDARWAQAEMEAAAGSDDDFPTPVATPVTATSASPALTPPPPPAHSAAVPYDSANTNKGGTECAATCIGHGPGAGECDSVGSSEWEEAVFPPLEPDADDDTGSELPRRPLSPPALHTGSDGRPSTRTWQRLSAVGVRLTVDHKGTEPNEVERIKRAGGFLSPDGRLNGILAVARSLGDFVIGWGLSACPDIFQHTYSPFWRRIATRSRITGPYEPPPSASTTAGIAPATTAVASSAAAPANATAPMASALANAAAAAPTAVGAAEPSATAPLLTAATASPVTPLGPAPSGTQMCLEATVTLEERDVGVVLACDGLWDVLSDTQVALLACGFPLAPASAALRRRQRARLGPHVSRGTSLSTPLAAGPLPDAPAAPATLAVAPPPPPHLAALPPWLNDDTDEVNALARDVAARLGREGRGWREAGVVEVMGSMPEPEGMYGPAPEIAARLRSAALAQQSTDNISVIALRFV